MSISLSVYNKACDLVGSVDFNLPEVNTEKVQHSIYLAAKYELAARRLGSANTKTRSEVSGGGKKPWRQKGTGRARAGSTRSPLWVGGGVIFGPQPRSYRFKLNKKVKQNARLGLFTLNASKIKVVEDFAFIDAPKAKLFSQFLKQMELTNSKVLILEDYRDNTNLVLATRNFPNVTLSLPANLSYVDFIDADVVLTTKASLAWLETFLARK